MHPAIEAAVRTYRERANQVDYVFPSDIKAAVLAALRHESVCGVDAVRQGVIEEIITEIEAAP